MKEFKATAAHITKHRPFVHDLHNDCGKKMDWVKWWCEWVIPTFREKVIKKDSNFDFMEKGTSVYQMFSTVVIEDILSSFPAGKRLIEQVMTENAKKLANHDDEDEALRERKCPLIQGYMSASYNNLPSMKTRNRSVEARCSTRTRVGYVGKLDKLERGNKFTKMLELNYAFAAMFYGRDTEKQTMEARLEAEGEMKFFKIEPFATATKLSGLLLHGRRDCLLPG